MSRRPAKGQLDLLDQVEKHEPKPCPCSDSDGGCGLTDLGPATYARFSDEYLFGMVAVFEGCALEDVTVDMAPSTRDGRHYLYQVQRRTAVKS